MKKTILFLILGMCLASSVVAQQINGKILSAQNNLTVVRVWGTHQERGYAAGFLLADKFTNAYENYISLAFGPYLGHAKAMIQSPYFFYIDPEYIEEAKSFIKGVHDAGYGKDLDFADILVGNCFLDIYGVLAGMASSSMGCSSLMSWGNATRGTDLNGKSVITRHVDWDMVPVLINNQVMVIHIPSEENEQPWLLVGFAGQISPMSGVNKSGVAVMHQSLQDFYSTALPFKAYEPSTFAMRRAIERIDYNADGVNSVLDIKASLTNNPYGMANNFVITGLAPSTAGSDEHIAIVAEIANIPPYYSIRNNSYLEDKIPGQNLYAANSSIARNDDLNFCDRYLNIIEQIGTGTRISAHGSWEMMKNYSVLPNRNLQFIQYIPELMSLKVGVSQRDGTIASQAPISRFNTNHLFNLPQNYNAAKASKMFFMPDEALTVFPVPAGEFVNVSFVVPEPGNVSVAIYNMLGAQVFHQSDVKQQGAYSLQLDISGLLPGAYVVRVLTPDGNRMSKFNVVK
jgi:hypothetical protein